MSICHWLTTSQLFRYRGARGAPSLRTRLHDPSVVPVCQILSVPVHQGFQKRQCLHGVLLCTYHRPRCIAPIVQDASHECVKGNWVETSNLALSSWLSVCYSSPVGDVARDSPLFVLGISATDDVDISFSSYRLAPITELFHTTPHLHAAHLLRCSANDCSRCCSYKSR